MGTVHVGRLRGEVGFGRMVAIKRLHAHFASDPEFVEMLLDEARIAARLRHPNVVPTIDVVSTGSELVLVMELVEGENLGTLQRELWSKSERMPAEIAAAIVCGVLNGLHEAHEASDETGRALDVVHRDVSPQNVLVGTDGLSRLVDFGIAKAALRASTTKQGEVRGKVAYMPPEQLSGDPVDRRADIYGAAAVFWEALAGRRLFAGDPQLVARKVLRSKIDPPSAFAPDVSPELDAIVMRGLSRVREQRYESALAMACAIEGAIRVATTREIAAWLAKRFGERLSAQRAWIATLERRGCAWHEAREAAVTAVEGVAASAPATTNPPREERPRPRRRTATLVGAMVGAALLATVLGAVAARAHATPAAAAARILPPAFVPEAARTVAVEPAPPVNPAPPLAAPAPPRRVATAPRAAPASACSPPYIIDAEGVRVPKPACF